MDRTPTEWPLRTAFSCQVTTSHSLMVLSRLPEARRFPSGLNATEVTASVCPLNECLSRPVATSHSFNSIKLLPFGPHPWPPEARSLPSGLNATDVTHTLCTRRVAFS